MLSRGRTPDPKKFEITHPSDGAAYKQIDELNREHKLAPLPFPAPRGLPEPTLSLAAVLDVSEAALEKQIAKSGQIVFHATGDTGSTRGPESQNLVADKMVADFTDDDADRPLFFFHLGDVIYSFGEGQYYYDQFYEPYRDYPAPIVAIAGNHDGMVAPGTKAASLAAFLENFCAEKFEVAPEIGRARSHRANSTRRVLYFRSADGADLNALQQYTGGSGRHRQR